MKFEMEKFIVGLFNGKYVREVHEYLKLISFEKKKLAKTGFGLLFLLITSKIVPKYCSFHQQTLKA